MESSFPPSPIWKGEKIVLVRKCGKHIFLCAPGWSWNYFCHPKMCSISLKTTPRKNYTTKPRETHKNKKTIRYIILGHYSPTRQFFRRVSPRTSPPLPGESACWGKGRLHTTDDGIIMKVWTPTPPPRSKTEMERYEISQKVLR